MRESTRQEHLTWTEEAVGFIFEHLDEPFTAVDVADRLGISRFYFHRLFQARIGESVADLVRRLRLERAAAHLRHGQEPITDIAIEAGYSTHEAFARAFRSAFGSTPSGLREHPGGDGLLPTPNGLHFGRPIKILERLLTGGRTMDIDIKELPPRKAVCMSHTGPYFMIGQTFGKLAQWRASQAAEFGQAVALYYDDAEVTPSDQLRSDAGFFVAGGFVVASADVHLVEVEGGPYAVTTYTGAYDGLSAAWDEFARSPLPAGYTLRPAPCFDVYVSMSEADGGASSVTELYLPIRRLSDG